MRIYARDQVCPFRFVRAEWGAFSNFQPPTVPIAAGPWTLPTSEHLYQAAKFGARPDVQQRIAEAPTPREAAAIGRTPGLGIDPGWNAQRVDVTDGPRTMLAMLAAVAALEPSHTKRSDDRPDPAGRPQLLLRARLRHRGRSAADPHRC